MTSLLLDSPLTREQREYAETIRASGDALLTIINEHPRLSPRSSRAASIWKMRRSSCAICVEGAH